jgi:hypothetical protein
VNGINIYRASEYLVVYTPAYGRSTRTNEFGTEVAVAKGKVMKVQTRVGDLAIPRGGFVISANGQAAVWLRANATPGASAGLSRHPPRRQPESPSSRQQPTPASASPDRGVVMLLVAGGALLVPGGLYLARRGRTRN